MSWTPRQRAMLAEMGTPLWFAPEPVDVSEAAPPARPEETAGTARTAASATASAPAPAPTPAPAPAQPATEPFTANATATAPVSGMNWPQLQEAVAACRACALSSSRAQAVFGLGYQRADWMIVGEAPDEDEDREGEPFAGLPGQLLDNMLRALALSRHAQPEAAKSATEVSADMPAGDLAKQVYITNILKCRPPAGRNPAPQELAQCEGFLLRQIELVQPKIILAMGRLSAQSLLRSSEPIGKLRGQVHRYHGVPLIVTYHPAYLLRNLQDKARAWDDLCLARQTWLGLSQPGV